MSDTTDTSVHDAVGSGESFSIGSEDVALLDLVASGELAHVTEGGEPRIFDDPSEIVSEPGQVATGESYPTLSGYAPDSYPEAQANGQQFDKGYGDGEAKVNPVATGKQEEANLAKAVGENVISKDNEGKSIEKEEKLAKKADQV
jgi:hypothetical protein